METNLENVQEISAVCMATIAGIVPGDRSASRIHCDYCINVKVDPLKQCRGNLLRNPRILQRCIVLLNLLS